MMLRRPSSVGNGDHRSIFALPIRSITVEVARSSGVGTVDLLPD